MTNELKVFVVKLKAKVYNEENILAKDEDEAKRIALERAKCTVINDGDSGCLNIESVKEEKYPFEIISNK